MNKLNDAVKRLDATIERLDMKHTFRDDASPNEAERLSELADHLERTAKLSRDPADVKKAAATQSLRAFARGVHQRALKAHRLLAENTTDPDQYRRSKQMIKFHEDKVRSLS